MATLAAAFLAAAFFALVGPGDGGGASGRVQRYGREDT